MVAVHHEDTLDRVEAARQADPHIAANHPERVTAAIESVHPSPTNPRKRFPEASIRELADTIESYGLMSPPLVRPHPTLEGEYELVAGERRLRAVRLLQWRTIPVLVRDLSNADVARMQLVENGQREDVHPLEEALAIFRVIEAPDDEGRYYTTEDVAVMLGKSVSYIDKRLKLLDLCESMREAFLDGTRLKAGVALVFARLTHDAQHAALTELSKLDGEITTRDAQEWVRKHVLLRLADAPFPLADATLGGEGACNGCAHRTSNMITLFDGEAADDCLKPACYRVKDAANWERRAAEARSDGLVVVDETATNTRDFAYVTAGSSAKNRYVAAKPGEDSIGDLAADLDVAPAALYRLRGTGKIEYAFKPDDLDRAVQAAAPAKAPNNDEDSTAASVPTPTPTNTASERDAARMALVREQEAAARQVVGRCASWLTESLSPHAILATRIALSSGVGAISGIDVPEGTATVAEAIAWVGRLSPADARAEVVKMLVDGEHLYRVDTDDGAERVRALEAAVRDDKLDGKAKTAPKPTRKPAAKPAEAPRRTLAEIGREAQREALLAALKSNGWNLTATARDLGLSGPSNVIRALKTLGLGEQYEAAKARGDIAPGRPT